MADWSVYMIECCDGSLYTGITTDVQRRFTQHQAGLGAKYFRARRPIHIAYLEDGHDKGSASRREAAIKKLTREQKLVLIAEGS